MSSTDFFLLSKSTYAYTRRHIAKTFFIYTTHTILWYNINICISRHAIRTIGTSQKKIHTTWFLPFTPLTHYDVILIKQKSIINQLIVWWWARIMWWKTSKTKNFFFWALHRFLFYIPNIRRCIGVGGLKDPQAKNKSFVGTTIIYTNESNQRTRQLNKFPFVICDSNFFLEIFVS